MREIDLFYCQDESFYMSCGKEINCLVGRRQGTEQTLGMLFINRTSRLMMCLLSILEMSIE